MMMASNPKAVSAQHQYDTKSPLDQIVNGTHSLPSRHTLLERAVTLTRKNSVAKGRAITGPDSTSSGGIDGSRQHRGYQLRDTQETADLSNGSTSSSRQQVQDLRAARLSQIHSGGLSAEPSLVPSSARRANHSSISNAFRDSVASDVSFNSISGPDERQSMAGTPFGFDEAESSIADDPDRIAEAVRGLTLRRRQSVDTVRSSEFGEGGRWDRAWGGSDEEEEDDGEESGLYDLGDLDIESSKPKDLREGGRRPRLSPGRNDASPTQPSMFAPNNGMQMPALHDASTVHHVVNLTLSMQRSRHQQPHLGQDNLHRRDTVVSMAGDIGQVSPTPSSRQQQHQHQHQHTDSSATIGQRDWNASRQSFGSDNSQMNAHVYVWPPTPAASEHGGSSDGQPSPNAGRDRLHARQSPALGVGQQATIEYYEPVSEPVLESKAASQAHVQHQPASPSTVLAQSSQFDARTNMAGSAQASASSGFRHPTGRAPPQPPSTKPQGAGEERYADPNKPLNQSPFADLGRTRRKAIADHDGRDSLVSDLDVETLRLDGSNGSEDWASRRGSISTLGSFSSEKIRDQRQRMSDTSLLSSRSDKRSSTDTIRESPAGPPPGREGQHRSWNGVQRRQDERSRSSFERNPKRSNTGPDSYNTTAREANGGQTGINGAAVQQQGVGSLTFSTPKPSRDARKPSVIVKGAIQQSQAEKFLTLAITHHESGDLSRSAYYFERSAKVEGGCVVGMCMWGMALREGWGVRKDERKGFDWISRAASRAGEMMAGSQGATKSESEVKAIRSELKLSVYELGKCFCYGWGVKMDKPMALEYFELAAKLGDADAQAEAGALLAAGKGCKKDLKKAAAYYRMAESQGYDTVGLSWIHKSKYDPAS